MRQMKWLLLLIVSLILVFAFASCGEEANTPETSALTTESSIQTEAKTTPAETSTIETSTPDETTTPETTSLPEWMAKIEKDLFEKAVEEDGNYYIYLTYRFGSSSYAVHDNQTFVDAYVADKKDIVFANLESGMISQGIYLRATAEEIEAYAKNSYVTGVYSYPQDKVVEGCKATFIRTGGVFDPYALLEIAEDDVGGSLPMVKIESKEELAACIDACVPTPDESYHSRWVLNQMAAGYDDAFFAEKTLFFLSAVDGNGAAQFSFVHALSDASFTIVIDQSTPRMSLSAVEYWAIFVEVDNNAIENQSKFISVLK